MKIKALAPKVALGLLTTAFVMQMVNVGVANPSSFGPPIRSFPTSTVLSPIENQSYPSNNVWFNLTITKPDDWLDTQYPGQIRYVMYIVDPSPDDHTWGDDEKKVTVQDPLDAMNPQTNISLSIPLEGLQSGRHTLVASFGGYINHTGIPRTMGTVDFTVFTTEANPTSTPSTTQHPTINTGAESPQTEPFQTSVLILAVIVVLGVCLVVGLLLKRKHEMKR